MRRNRNAQRLSGFTIVELLVVIGIITVLLSLLLPALSQARAQAQLVQCAANLRQIMLGETMYAADNHGYIELPCFTSIFIFNETVNSTVGSTPAGVPTFQAAGLLYSKGYITNPRVFFCPTVTDPRFMYDSAWSDPCTANMRSGYPMRWDIVTNPGRIVDPAAGTGGGFDFVKIPQLLSENNNNSMTIVYDYTLGYDDCVTGPSGGVGGEAALSHHANGINTKFKFNVGFIDGHVGTDISNYFLGQKLLPWDKTTHQWDNPSNL